MGTVPKPAYVVLCNFDEFWIYDFNIQMDDPVDRVQLDDLPRRCRGFQFPLPHAEGTAVPQQSGRRHSQGCRQGGSDCSTT